MAKVSACIIAYNHEEFIKDCLDGALAQKVNFNYEIIISEDYSTDNTRQIVKEYQSKYPDKIKLFLNEKNLGLIGNWIKALSRCQGDYVAICEGDDYWTDPNKLQKQVDFLDSHPNFNLSSHNANIEKYSQIVGQYCQSNHPEIIDLEYLLTQGSGGPTCSLVIKNQAIQNLPEWFARMKACDWTIQVMAARTGKMKYFPEIMSVYRKHGKGANFSAKKNARAIGESEIGLPSKYTLEMINNLNKYFEYSYEKQLRKQSTSWYNLYINEYLKIADIKMAKKYARKILKEIFYLNYWKNSWLTKKYFFRLLALTFLPTFILKFLKKYKLKNQEK